MKKISLIAVIVTLFTASLGFACDDKKCPECEKGKQANASFESLKKLAGNWEGKTSMSGTEETVKASYEVTSGGAAVVEKIFAGTPHEMVSIYYPEGKTVKMTHYCMVGNRPVMTLKSSTDKNLAFEMNGHEGIGSKKEMHMHALDVLWNSENQFTQNWTSFDKGKKSESVTFVWNRVEDKPAPAVAPTKPTKSSGNKSTK